MKPEARNDRKVYYTTTSMCPECARLLPAEVCAMDGGVFVARECPEHGPALGLACSDVAWFESLPRFDVEPARPASHQRETDLGCPSDCGLCPSHRQSAGTAAIEISNRCNASCPVCLADNQATFELSPEEVSLLADSLLARQGSVDAFVLSGGEPSIHPRLPEILRVLERPGVSRIVMNSNGLRIAEDDGFLDELARHPNLYVCLHQDGPGASAIRGISPAVQDRALERLLARRIKVAPVTLAVRGANDSALGSTVVRLLTRSPDVKSVTVSMMTYAGRRGSRFPVDPRARLTIPEALERMEADSKGALHKRDFMPLPMPNPLCAAIGYFLVQGSRITPLIPLAKDIDEVIDYTKNAHFASAGPELERFFREAIDRVYSRADDLGLADPRGAAEAFKALVGELYPTGSPLSEGERRRRAEERIKTVFVMQFMDRYTFDSVRLKKCSCQHLVPDGDGREGRVIPSCGYYAYHRGMDARFPA
jgi:7,8-dihydro-6-hydroxymethylpterin dimethyltransferase